MNKHEFMSAAIDLAYAGINNRCGGPFGCVITKNGKIVGEGHNRVLEKQDPTCHGEMEAIRSACANLGTFDLSGCELYTTSAPCPMCAGAIRWANIKKVFVGCNVQDAENIGFRDKLFFETELETEELDRAACLQLFADYAAKNPTLY